MTEPRGHVHQLRQRSRLHLAHHATAVRLYCDLADAEITADLFVELTAHHQRHHLTLAKSEGFVAVPQDLQIHFLIEEGAAETLASPNLVTDSGTPATFHAGGEIPYVTNTSLGSTHVQFKPYGVAVNVQPLVLDDGSVRMKVKAEVSSPDPSNGTFLSGTSVPAFREREVASNVTLRDGATMMLAGLTQTQRDEVNSGVPILRRVPLLGALFRWKRTNHRRTTIIIFVTPRVVPPHVRP